VAFLNKGLQTCQIFQSKKWKGKTGKHVVLRKKNTGFDPRLKLGSIMRFETFMVAGVQFPPVYNRNL
jgi:hypothetical protein